MSELLRFSVQDFCRMALPLLLALCLASPTMAQNNHSPDNLSVAEGIALEALGEVHAKQYPLESGWYLGRAVQYYDFGATELEAGSLYRVQGGGTVVSSLPGLPNYSSVR